ncbi:MAG: hypothetical protein HON20_03845, partial [Cellvibrionales bacterium]|nr:hypothetical protein [Cellvibrionales bacterium]
MSRLSSRLFFVLVLLLASVSCTKKEPPLQNNLDTNDETSVVDEQKTVTISGKIVLGPVIAENNLWVYLYTQDENISGSTKLLGSAKVAPDGTYQIDIPSNSGMVLTKVISKDPSKPDYIDEATGEPKALGNNILSSVFIVDPKVENSAGYKVQKVNINPLTTVAVRSLGVDFREDRFWLTKKLSVESVNSSNKKINRFFCGGDEDINKVEVKPIISIYKLYQDGNSCGNALAAISGLDSIYAGTNKTPLNKIIEDMSASINKSSSKDQLPQSTQVEMVLGLKKVTENLNSSEISTLSNFSKYQDQFESSSESS